MLREAMTAPFRTDDAATTAFMGGVLVLVSTLALPVLFVSLSATVFALLLCPLAVFPPLVLRGYYVRAVRTGLDGEAAAPSFVDWGALVRDGARSLVLSAVYLAPAMLLLAAGTVAGFALVTGRVTTSETKGVVAAVGLVGVAFLLVGYLLVYTYLRPAALAVLAAEGRLRPALDPRRALDVARNRRYGGGWILANGLLQVCLLLALPLSLLLVGFFLTFYFRVAAHRLYGRGAATALAAVPSTERKADGPSERAADAFPSMPSASVQTGRTVGFDRVDVDGGVNVDGSEDSTDSANVDDNSDVDDDFHWNPVETPDE